MSVFENRVLRRIFGPKRDEVTGQLEIVHNYEPNDLCWSPNIVRMIKSRRMSWGWRVARVGEKRRIQRFGGEIWGEETTWKTQA
jgi:hypothetical protein